MLISVYKPKRVRLHQVSTNRLYKLMQTYKMWHIDIQLHESIAAIAKNFWQHKTL